MYGKAATGVPREFFLAVSGAAFGDEALSGTDQGGKGCVHKIDRMYGTPVEGLRRQG